MKTALILVWLAWAIAFGVNLLDHRTIQHLRSQLAMCEGR